MNPCSGAPGTVNGTAKNGVFHITTLANGTSWATFTAQGAITFVPDIPADASASGDFATWDGENVNLRNGTEMSTFYAVLGRQRRSPFAIPGPSRSLLRRPGGVGREAGVGSVADLSFEGPECPFVDPSLGDFGRSGRGRRCAGAGSG